MKTRFSLWFAVCASLVAFVLTLSPAFAQASKEQEAKEKTAKERAEALRLVDAWLDSVQAYQHIPAISAGVVVGDDLIWAKGYGTIDEQHMVPSSSKTIYSICSISKLFTSVALMQQYENGKVRLDEAVSTYLPWAKLKESGEDSVPITLRGILTHSAGLPRESDFPYWSGPDFPFPTREQVHTTFATQSPLYPAERYFQYSNLGLTLAGEVVEQVSGEPYARYAKEQVLDPLGLNDTRTFMPMDLYGKRLAVGYGALKRDGSRDRVKPFDTKGITPAAGYLDGGRSRQVRILAIPPAAYREAGCPEGLDASRNAAGPVRRSILEGKLGAWVLDRSQRQRHLCGAWRLLPGL